MNDNNLNYALLAEKVKFSDHNAYIKLFNELWEPMFIYARAIVGDYDLAKDLLQNIWTIYWEKRNKIDAKNIKAYLYTSLRNECYRDLTSQGKFNTVQLDVINEIDLKEQERFSSSYEDLSNSIDESLKSLPKRCQEIFIMSRVNGLSNDQIAVEYKISKRTVENQLSIALKKVRRDLMHFIGTLV